MKNAHWLMLLALSVPVLTAPASAAPVHVALKASAAVPADAQGFFQLGSVADLSGGDAPMRERMAGVPIGRVPLSGATRLLTGGDVCLKLRQAGFHPDAAIVLDGAPQAAVTVAQEAPPALLPATECQRLGANNGGARKDEVLSALVPPLLGGRGPLAAQPLIHPGDAITILVQSDALTVTARGVARQAGSPGDTIRVHRDGVMTDLTVTVVDAQTVQLEM